ncbi:MAG: hypothetical protein K5770_05890 [Lachnospiraceae bacterium]|nr:hypothetical protein [Lachnospiraceae bacterium]
MAPVRKQRKKKKSETITGILAALILVFVVSGIVAAIVLSHREYATVSLKDFYFKTYSGYNGKGTIEADLNEGMFNEKISEAIANYNKSFFKSKDISEDDFKSLISTLYVNLPPENSLKNGDTINILYNCDLALANRLNIRIEGREETVNVAGLKDAKLYSVEDLFRDIEPDFKGMSPNITLNLINNSEDPFLQNIVYSPVEYREFYTAGEIVKIRAFFSEAECLNSQVAVERPSTECVKEYTAQGEGEYVKSASDLNREVLLEAAEAGKKAFNDANAWGVRVFIEAGLVPIYINKQATFSWLSPSVNRLYFKSVKDSAAGKSGNHYNDLDIIYSCDMTQADGVTTSVRAAVRFSDIIKMADGSLSYDFSSPSIISASHIAKNVTKVVSDYYQSDYFIEEISLN